MNRGTATFPGTVQPTSADEAWEALKRRFVVGQHIEGVVVKCEVFGAFLDIGEPFWGFIDALDLPQEPLKRGDKRTVRILQFADYNRQVRVAPSEGKQ